MSVVAVTPTATDLDARSSALHHNSAYALEFTPSTAVTVRRSLPAFIGAEPADTCFKAVARTVTVQLFLVAGLKHISLSFEFQCRARPFQGTLSVSASP